MKNKILTTTAILLPVLFFSFKATTNVGSADAGTKKKGEVEWHAFDVGMERAKKENKLLVIDFYTDWCHWCKVMDKDTYGNKDVMEYAKKNLILAKVNAETAEKFKYKDASYSGRELAMMFGVTGYPMTAFMSAEGEFLGKRAGFIPADEFNVVVKFLAEEWYKKMEYEEFVKQESEGDNG